MAEAPETIGAAAEPAPAGDGQRVAHHHALRKHALGGARSIRNKNVGHRVYSVYGDNVAPARGYWPSSRWSGPRPRRPKSRETVNPRPRLRAA